MSPADASEFAHAFSRGRAERVKAIESLCWLERRVRNDGMSTYLVQVVSQPHRIILCQALDTLFVFLSVKCRIESVAEVR